MHAALQSQRLLNTSVFIVWRRSHCLFHPRKEGNMKLEHLRAEMAVVKKEIALREERCAAQLKAKKLRSSKNSAKKGID